MLRMSACLYIWVCVFVFVHKFCKHEIYHFHYPISDYHSSKLSNVGMLQEHKLCCRSLASSLFFSVYYAYFLTIDNTLIMIYEV